MFQFSDARRSAELARRLFSIGESLAVRFHSAGQKSGKLADAKSEAILIGRAAYRTMHNPENNAHPERSFFMKGNSIGLDRRKAEL